MRALGHNRTGLECRSKTKTMRAEYFRCVAHNRIPGEAPVTCPYFEVQRAIYGECNGDRRPKRVPRSLKLIKKKHMMEDSSQQQPYDPDEGPSTARSHPRIDAEPERMEMVTLNLFPILPGEEAVLHCPTSLASETQLPEPSTQASEKISPQREEDQGSDSSATAIDYIPPTLSVQSVAVPCLQLTPGPRDAPGDEMSGEEEEEPAAQRTVEAPRPLSIMGPRKRTRRGQKHVSVLTNLGQRLLKQGEEDMRQCRAIADSLVRLERERMNKMEAISNRELENSREEARLAREMFSASMQENNAILRGTVQSMNRMGDLVERIVVLMEAREKWELASPPHPTTSQIPPTPPASTSPHSWN
ncbi:uncharacterized protein LOC143822684 isoform X2 [Paroedura picta]